LETQVKSDDVIKMYLKEMGCDVDCIRRAYDSVQWRAVMDT